MPLTPLRAIFMSQVERRQSPFILLPKDMHESMGFRDLTFAGVKVLLWFLSDAYVGTRKEGKHKVRFIEANGDLRFTFEKAQARGISRASFSRAILDLIDHGFLSIAHQGSGLHRDANRYHMDARWIKWGTPDFQAVSRPTPGISVGFRKGHAPYPFRGDGKNS